MSARKVHRSRILPVVLIGFAIFLVMVVAFGYLSSQQLTQMLEGSGEIAKNPRNIEITVQHMGRIRLLLMTMLAGGLLILLFMIQVIRRMEARLLKERQKADVTLGNISDAVISVDRKGQIEYANPVAASLFGRPLKELESLSIIELLGGGGEGVEALSDRIRQILEQSARETGVEQFRIRLAHRPKQVLSVSLSLISTRPGEIQGLVLSFRDISESEALLDKVRYLASHDALTSLLNRRAFEQSVRQRLENFKGGEEYVYGIFDLDQFKIINDSAGHMAGDELLRQLSAHLQALMPPGGLLCRLGGDEFAFFLRSSDEQATLDFVHKLLDRIEGFAFTWEDNIYRLTASVGLVPVKSGLIDYDHLYRSADLACYTAKNEGRNRWQFAPMDADLLREKSKESARLKYLAGSLEKGENLVLFMQEIVPISPRMKGHQHAEVLIRMRGVDGKVVPPMAFLPLAERYGLMEKIDRWVLQRVCDYIAGQPADRTVLAVNLSGQSLSSVAAMKELLRIIIDSRIPPQRLCIEVTETVAIGNLETAIRFMDVLRERGCSIALDDFGSGLSSFSYLSNLPLDYIKIDGVFIRRMAEDPAAQATVEAIHFIANKLGLRTVAEFVGDEESVRQLKNIGIDLAQGYHYGYPVPLDNEDTVEITMELRAISG